MKAGFTLVETLVALSGLGALAGLTFIGVSTAHDRVAAAEEIQAARSLINAYHSHMADSSSRMLPGYDGEAQALALDGSKLPPEIAAHYPWRLLPYIGEPSDGLLLDEKMETYVELSGTASDTFLAEQPDFGINAEFVGGDSRVSLEDSRHVKSLGQVADANQLIVFTSSHGTVSSVVRAPNSPTTPWKESEFHPKGLPSDHGQVDFRRDGKAVTITLDGSVSHRSEQDLRDMSHWSNK